MIVRVSQTGTDLMNQDSNAILFDRLASGDREALAEIYRRNKDMVYGFALRMLRDPAAAEDVTHETFVFLMEQPARYDRELSGLGTFLCAVARRKVMNLARRRYQADLPMGEFAERLQMDAGDPDGPLDRLLGLERARHIEECIADLSPGHREVLVLREFHELTYDEIAIVTETEVGTVKTRLYRARQALATALSGYIAPRKTATETRKYHEVCGN